MFLLWRAFSSGVSITVIVTWTDGAAARISLAFSEGCKGEILPKFLHQLQSQRLPRIIRLPQCGQRMVGMGISPSLGADLMTPDLRVDQSPSPHHK